MEAQPYVQQHHMGLSRYPVLLSRDTTVSGVNQDNPQRNFILGCELVVSPNSRNSFTLEFAKAAVHKNGPSLTGFTVKYDDTWGKDYR